MEHNPLKPYTNTSTHAHTISLGKDIFRRILGDHTHIEHLVILADLYFNSN